MAKSLGRMRTRRNNTSGTWPPLVVSALLCASSKSTASTSCGLGCWTASTAVPAAPPLDTRATVRLSYALKPAPRRLSDGFVAPPRLAKMLSLRAFTGFCGRASTWSAAICSANARTCICATVFNLLRDIVAHVGSACTELNRSSASRWLAKTVAATARAMGALPGLFVISGDGCRAWGRLRATATKKGGQRDARARRCLAAQAFCESRRRRKPRPSTRCQGVTPQTAQRLALGENTPKIRHRRDPPPRNENNYTYRENASSAGADSSCSACAEGDISMARYVSQKYDTPLATATRYSCGTKSCWTACTGDQT